MKMKSYVMPALALALFTTVISCKKESSTTPTDNSTELQTQSDDQNNVSAEVDDVSGDADIAMESNGSFSGRAQDVQGNDEIYGGVVVYDTTGNVRKVTITYNDSTANRKGNAKRKGVVVISLPMGVRWKDANAAITVDIQNLKITRISNNKSITINGTHTITNVSGGLVRNFPNAPTQVLIQTITSNNMSITFDDGTQRTWHVARRREIKLEGMAIVVRVTGIGATGGITNACEWGMNRANHEFVTSITEPLIYRSDCKFGITGGQIKHTGIGTSTVTFGLNANGIATTCPVTGSFFYKIVWTGPNGNSVSAIHTY